MIVDVEVMKRNYSKEDFVWILGNLFLATGWLIIGIHYLHSVLICTVNTFKMHFSVQSEPESNYDC